MSNIHSFTNIRKNQTPEDQEQQAQLVHMSLDSGGSQQETYTLHDGSTSIDGYVPIPKYLVTSYWSLNISPTSEPGICDYLKDSCYPCCVGYCCTEVIKKDFCELLLKFAFWFMIIQLVLFIVSLYISEKISGVLEPDTGALLKLGAMSTYELRKEYQIWRLFSMMFLHGNVFHIFCNTFAQLMFVLGAEKNWGTWRFLLIYIGGGLLGAMFSSLRSLPYGNGCAVGASGAILSTMGAYVSLIIIYFSRISRQNRCMVFFWIVMFIMMCVVVSFLPKVDWLGHIGGFIGGFALGLIIFGKGGATKKASFWYLFIGIIVLVLEFFISLCYLIFYK